jgi:hypothetical protein
MGPEQLLKQDDGTFAMRSKARSHVAFTIEGDAATSMNVDPSDFGAPLSGARVGPGDPATFHHQLQQ